MKPTLRIALFCLLVAAAVSAQQVQLSAGYLHQRSNSTPTGDWFGAQGARADVGLAAWRNLGVVAEFSGVHAPDIGPAGQGLTLFTYTAGPRLTVPLTRFEKRRLAVFAQTLFGGVHASDGIFPNGAINKSTASAFAMSSGGGVEMGLKHGLSVRLIQADYLYTRLPNLFGNYQNSFRVGAGIRYRLRQAGR